MRNKKEIIKEKIWEKLDKNKLTIEEFKGRLDILTNYYKLSINMIEEHFEILYRTPEEIYNNYNLIKNNYECFEGKNLVEELSRNPESLKEVCELYKNDKKEKSKDESIHMKYYLFSNLGIPLEVIDNVPEITNRTRKEINESLLFLNSKNFLFNNKDIYLLVGLLSLPPIELKKRYELFVNNKENNGYDTKKYLLLDPNILDIILKEARPKLDNYYESQRNI